MTPRSPAYQIRKDGLGIPTETTEAGLIVPMGTIEKEPKTLLRAVAKRLVRAEQMMHAEGIALAMGCTKCFKPVKVAADDTMECECRKWSVR